MINLKFLFNLSLVILALFPLKKSVMTSVPSDKEEKFIKTELFFGLNKTDGATVSEAEWESFADSVVSKVFYKGATIMKSDGRWLSGDSLIKEQSRVVTYFSRLYEMTDEFSEKIDLIREKYKAYYKQEAVLRTDEFINASF